MRAHLSFDFTPSEKCSVKDAEEMLEHWLAGFADSDVEITDVNTGDVINVIVIDHDDIKAAVEV